MIVPSSRLLFWVAAIVLPFAALGVAVPGATTLSVALIAALFLLVILDAILARGVLDGIGVELPEVVRLSKDREGTVELRIKNDTMKTKRLRVGLAFPREIVSPHEDLLALLPAESQFSRVPWPCTPVKRGNFILDTCYFEAASPLGFWSKRGSVPAHAEIRVYPNLLTERKHVGALFLNWGGLGVHAQRQVGKGREFEKLREYVPGDSYDDIHWKATARRGRPVTKMFQIERTQEVYVIIDASRLSARTPGIAHPADGPGGGIENGTETSVLERFITAALILSLAADRQGDLFGLMTFSDKVHGFVRARNGKAHYNACRDALYTVQPRIVTPDFDEICSYIRLRLRRRALLVFLTSLDDPILAESFVRNVDLIHRQHLVLVNMLRPAGAQPLFADSNAASVDSVYQHLGGHILWHNLRELEKVLQRRGVRLFQLDNEKMSAQVVTQYINIKRRQLL